MTKRRWQMAAWAAAAVAALFVAAVGPWPLSSGEFSDASYYRRAVADLQRSTARHRQSPAPGRLRAGWGQAKLQPPVGTPLAGYGGRKGRPSLGTHDDLWVKTVALSDGDDTAVLIGSDLLVVPPGIAEATRRAVAQETPLRADDLLFSASHTHSGPGSLAPGFAAELFFGPFKPDVPAALSRAFVEAVLEAYRNLQPARMARGSADGRDLIRNRTRDASVDGEISILLLEQDSGRRCVVFSFSAHPTLLGADNMQFSPDYPGYARRFLEERTGAAAVFLGGAVGSMSCRAPDNTEGARRDPFDRCRAMGEQLGARVLRATETPSWEATAEIASVGAGFDLPPLQWRPVSPGWRASNILTRALGLPSRGWISMVRAGRALFVAVPGDLSGEISADWKRWAAGRGYDLWCSSFSGEYAGYISPDRYYAQWADAKGQPAYETAVMSWLGPKQEAICTALMQQAFEAVTTTSAPDLDSPH